MWAGQLSSGNITQSSCSAKLLVSNVTQTVSLRSRKTKMKDKQGSWGSVRKAALPHSESKETSSEEQDRQGAKKRQVRQGL